MKSSRIIKRGCIVAAVVVPLLLIFAFLISVLIPSTPRRALPDSATDTQEFKTGLKDYVRLFKAKLPKEDYERYAAALELTQRFDKTQHQEIKRAIEKGVELAPAWWVQPNTNETTFFNHVEGDDYAQVLTYSEDSIYYLEISW